MSKLRIHAFLGLILLLSSSLVQSFFLPHQRFNGRKQIAVKNLAKITSKSQLKSHSSFSRKRINRVGRLQHRLSAATTSAPVSPALRVTGSHQEQQQQMKLGVLFLNLGGPERMEVSRVCTALFGFLLCGLSNFCFEVITQSSCVLLRLTPSTSSISRRM